MELSSRLKNFLKTGKVNPYDQAKEILRGKSSGELEEILSLLAPEQKIQLLAEEWGKTDEENKRKLAAYLYSKNLDKLTDDFTELSENEQVKRIEILGYLPDPEVAFFLLGQMKSKREAIRLSACGALKKQQLENILEPLLIALTKPEEWLPSRVFEIIKGFRKDLHIQLINMVDKVETPVQEVIVQVLGEIGDHSCLPVLEKLSKVQEDKIRMRIAEALKQLCIRKSWPLLIKLMEDNQWQTRMLAVQTLGQLGIQETIPLLQQKKIFENDDLVKECIDDAITAIESACMPVAVSWVRE
ncbi:MAG: HEAT repeat domain-containing protein [Bacillota bacterium]